MNLKNERFFKIDQAQQHYAIQGNWEITELEIIKSQLHKIPQPKGNIVIDGQAITHLDSAGAWLLNDWLEQLAQQKVAIQLINFSKQSQKLLSIVKEKTQQNIGLIEPEPTTWLMRTGKQAIQQLDEFCDYLQFVGELSIEALRILSRPTRWRWPSIANIIDTSGYQALPIIALLSFMIGVVISYQMGNQLRNYGANIFIVDLLGLSVLREFGPLLTAIMVAGRTGSAFTAQLGMMKINQEIDALNTLGVTPGELLLLPRMLGLFIALPLLTMWADIFGIIGGMVMANNMLGVSWHDFLDRFQSEIPLRALLIGLGKAPVFAMIISSVACFEGMKVSGSADSVGKQTTRSVVLSIFFIIVADAIFSVIFSKLKL